ncbi:hypothetical protein [Listeria rocourtiae]|uniref:hypothetical protein n=1 Tax=Listeria rocourtiae TaxID=647910 RepID=UPI0003E892AA|nr:hypothetical protein [Listeria rocourtiae]EUJ47380.1 hypothetical protein PROCOU_09806 [Listeria rocourtiae FSL F6-920]
MLTNNRIFIIEDNFMHREEVLDAVTQFSTRLDTSFDIEIIEDFTKFANNLSPKLVKDTDIYLLDIDLKSFFLGLIFPK